MPRRRTTRKLELFTINAHNDGVEIDYVDLFSALAEHPIRILVTQEKLIAIPSIEIDGATARLIAYEGAPGTDPLIFNIEYFHERVEELGGEEILATKTHAVLDLARREAVIEYVHRGAKAADIARVLESVAAEVEGWHGLVLDFNPLIRSDFLAEVDRFERIRVASVQLSRPNRSWTDDAQASIMELADASNGHEVAVEIRAPRGGELDRNAGIMRLLRGLVQRPLSMLKNGSVVGRRPGETAETKVSLLKHTEHQRIDVGMDDHGHVVDEDITAQADRFLDSRRRQE